MISQRESIRRRRALFGYLPFASCAALAAALALAGSVPVMAAAASTTASGGSWSKPRELQAPPDFAGGGQVTALSCFAGSNCTAVGNYQDRPGRYLFFSITERRGVWGKGVGIAAPAGLKNADIEPGVTLSCASAGNCAAGLSEISSAQEGAIVVSETNGTWGKAEQVPVPSPNSVAGLSCPAAGACTAALASGYLLNETHGIWRKPFQVPGLGGLHGSFISLGPISCSSPGNCTATGNYESNGDRSFAVTEKQGIWGDPQPISTSQGAWSVLYSLSCTSAANCVAGGYLYPLSGYSGGFTATETNGRWATAESLPGTFRVGGAGADEVDCPAAGECRALGVFAVNYELEPFTSTEKGGSWSTAQIITGTGNLGSAGDSLACATDSDCVIAGVIEHDGQNQAGTASLENGHWGPDEILPGILAADHGADSSINAVSCPPRGRCTAIGSFRTTLFTTAQI